MILRYKVTLNWKGELHTFYTSTTSPRKARLNSVSRLARRLDVSGYSVRQYFESEKDRWKVERR